MITIKKTNSDNPDFKNLVIELDADLKFYYKEEKSFYGKLNNIDKIKHVIVAYDEHKNAIGCGGIKEFSQNKMEIKRMYVPNNYRKKGIATIILKGLENWSSELNFEKCILETLKEKPYAIEFYKKNDYKIIPNFGEYINAENSICFEKRI
ncbi:GNAT superfamily N-acetyltransferase [Wenyingzhuangia heitensis]|uniref:GNAT superfamily N-acetyltransferase n=1 Tax=Wenyingzhuangia heitensis TaxID=1487859 RepID=A0ABX0UA10_9FLAO|nr:GNAT family N-acetyltransferase [Wenyingzhuangia heitensis]NIJ45204.1 GNAT superfamily N-acetyltransferase [Wenyingzhuangia heitensis]